MSIKDKNGNEIVTLNTIHAMAFRVLIWIGIIGTPVVAGMFWTMNEKIASNSKDLTFHEWRLTALESRKSLGVTQSTDAGSAESVVGVKSAKTRLTTQEVALRRDTENPKQKQSQ